MRDPLPAEELRNMLGRNGFLRLHGQDRFLFVSDAPRRVPREALAQLQHTMREAGFAVETDPSDLLLIDLRPSRWEELLGSFPHAEASAFPDDGRLLDVYALMRLLKRHPSALELQPMDMIRAVFKNYHGRDGLPSLAPKLLSRCAERLRRNAPLPSALADVLYSWLAEQKEEART
jgi:hypothetical protein